MTQWKFTWGVERQMNAFMKGFDNIIPMEWIQMFNERELEVIPAPPALSPSSFSFLLLSFPLSSAS